MRCAMIRKLAVLVLALIVTGVIATDAIASSKRKAEDYDIEPKVSKLRAYPGIAMERVESEAVVNLSAMYPRNYRVLNIDLSFNKYLDNVNFLLGFPGLTDLNLNFCENLGDNYKAISGLTSLKRLEIYGIGLTTTEYLKPLVKLEYLNIWCPDLGKFIEPLSHLNLKELRISGCEWKGLTELSKLISLESLILKDFWQQDEGQEEFPPLDFIAHLVNLKRLDLSDNIYITHINPIGSLPVLAHLNLSGCYNIVDLECINKSISIQELDLSRMYPSCISITKESLVALTQLNSLRKLIIYEFTELPDSFSPLVEIIKS